MLDCFLSRQAAPPLPLLLMSPFFEARKHCLPREPLRQAPFSQAKLSPSKMSGVGEYNDVWLHTSKLLDLPGLAAAVTAVEAALQQAAGGSAAPGASPRSLAHSVIELAWTAAQWAAKALVTLDVAAAGGSGSADPRSSKTLAQALSALAHAEEAAALAGVGGAASVLPRPTLQEDANIDFTAVPWAAPAVEAARAGRVGPALALCRAALGAAALRAAFLELAAWEEGLTRSILPLQEWIDFWLEREGWGNASEEELLAGGGSYRGRGGARDASGGSPRAAPPNSAAAAGAGAAVGVSGIVAGSAYGSDSQSGSGGLLSAATSLFGRRGSVPHHAPVSSGAARRASVSGATASDDEGEGSSSDEDDDVASTATTVTTRRGSVGGAEGHWRLQPVAHHHHHHHHHHRSRQAAGVLSALATPWELPGSGVFPRPLSDAWEGGPAEWGVVAALLTAQAAQGTVSTLASLARGAMKRVQRNSTTGNGATTALLPPPPATPSRLSRARAAAADALARRANLWVLSPAAKVALLQTLQTTTMTAVGLARRGLGDFAEAVDASFGGHGHGHHHHHAAAAAASPSSNSGEDSEAPPVPWWVASFTPAQSSSSSPSPSASVSPLLTHCLDVLRHVLRRAEALAPPAPGALPLTAEVPPCPLLGEDDASPVSTGLFLTDAAGYLAACAAARGALLRRVDSSLYWLSPRRPIQRHWATTLAAAAGVGWAAAQLRSNGDSVRDWLATTSSSLASFFHDHVAAPTAAMLREIFGGRREVIADPAALQDARAALTKMLTSFNQRVALRPPVLASVPDDLRAALTSPDAAASLAAALDMRPVSAVIAHELPRPLVGMVAGDLVEALLLEVAHIKAEVLAAMGALDTILQDNQFNLQVATTLPAGIVAFSLFTGVRRVLGGVMGPPDATLTRRRLRLLLRDVQRLLSHAEAGAAKQQATTAATAAVTGVVEEAKTEKAAQPAPAHRARTRLFVEVDRPDAGPRLLVGGSHPPTAPAVHHQPAALLHRRHSLHASHTTHPSAHASFAGLTATQVGCLVVLLRRVVTALLQLRRLMRPALPFGEWARVLEDAADLLSPQSTIAMRQAAVARLLAYDGLSSVY